MSLLDSDSDFENYDVFFCHNSKDKPEIRHLEDDLIELGIKPWLDERDILPGYPWKSAIEDQVSKIKSKAIFIGANDIGKYQHREVQFLIDEHDNRAFSYHSGFLDITHIRARFTFFSQTISSCRFS